MRTHHRVIHRATRLVRCVAVSVGLIAVAGGAARADGISLQEPLAAHIYPNSGSANGLAAGDFNGDGKIDLAVAQEIQNSGDILRGHVSVQLGLGDGEFAAPAHMPLPTSPSTFAYGLLARDFNQDGKLDLVATTYAAGKVLFFAGNGNGTFANYVAYATGARPLDIQTADLNGDGRLDLVTTNNSDHSISVLLAQAGGGWAAPVIHATSTNPQQTAIGDFNADGKSDLAVGCYDARVVNIFVNPGNGAFGTKTDFNIQSQITGINAGDYNDDGKVDLAMNAWAGPNNVPTFCVVVATGNGNGTFNMPVFAQFQGTEGWSLQRYSDNTPVDLNGDGHLDMVFAHSEFNYVSVALGGGDGSFVIAPYVGSAGTGNIGQRPEPVDQVSVITGDFNGDGRPDIAVGNRQTNHRQGSISVLRADPARPGGFLAPSAYVSRNWSTSTRPHAMADFTGDGIPDVIAVTDLLDIYVGKPDGTFNPALQVVGRISGPGEFYNTLRVADFNNDGKMDFVLNATGGVQGGPFPRTVFGFGNGQGGFAVSVVGTPNSAAAVNNCIADFNNDGTPDLALWTGGNFNGTIYVYTPATSLTPVSLNPNSVSLYVGGAMTAGDFDRDGKQDLVSYSGAVDTTPARILFFKGNGNGTFKPATIAATSFGLVGELGELRTADLNGDGKLDVIGSYYGSVYVFKGNGNGTLQAPVAYGGGNDYANDFELADLDRDGVLDAVVAYWGGLTVYRGDGAGGFGPAGIVPTGRGAWSVEVGDVNGDGRLDIAVGHGSYGNPAYCLTLLQNISSPVVALPISVTGPAAPVIGGKTATGKVTLSAQAPSGGANVALTSSNPAAVSVPGFVKVLAGAKTANFTITTFAVASASSSVISASRGGVTKTMTVNVAAPALLSITVPATAVGGAKPTGSVKLTGNAAVDTEVTLSSTNSAAAVPATVVIPAGASSKTFVITTSAVAANTTGAITAAYGGVSKSVNITVVPPALASITVPSSPIVGSKTATGTVKLNGAASANVVVTLSSANPAASVPATLTIPAGATSKTFTITTNAVSSDTTGLITASYNGVDKSKNVTVRPVSVQSVTASPNPVTGGTNATGKVTLEAPAGPGAITVTLSSSNPTVANPAVGSVNVAAGTNQATFTINSTAVSANTPVTITATTNGRSKTYLLTVKP